MKTLEDGSMASEGGILPSQCTMLTSEGVMTLSGSGMYFTFLGQHGEFGWRQMFWKAASNFGERGFRKAVSCSQRAEWWIQTEGSVLPSKNGNVVSEGRGWQHVFGLGEGI